MRDSRRDSDVLVLGGGPAGAAAALILARGGLTVVLVERNSTACSYRPGEALPPTAAAILFRLGVWEAFLAAGHRRSPGIVADWGGGPPTEIDFLLSAHGPGWHIDRARFDADLVAAARAAGVEVLNGRRASACDHCADGRWRVQFDGDHGVRSTTVSASWVIDATGRSAWFARRHGARSRSLDRLIGMVADAESAAEADRRLALEACADGWWYSAVLPGDRAVVAWMTDADLVPRSREDRRRCWLERLGRTQLVRARLGGPKRIGRLRVVAARSSRLDRVSGPGWVAVGDAAMALDPLSGRGIVKAIESGQAAAEALLAWFGGDLEAPSRLAGHFASTFDRYRDLRLAYYARERRWPDAAFWGRRHFPSPDGALLPARSQPSDSPLG
jgi:flavin-dependent dehydrogenase